MLIRIIYLTFGVNCGEKHGGQPHNTTPAHFQLHPHADALKRTDHNHFYHCFAATASWCGRGSDPGNFRVESR